MHAASEEKPITVDRPNRTYVFYLASEMKFNKTCETRDETRARIKSNNVISGDTKQLDSDENFKLAALQLRTKCATNWTRGALVARSQTSSIQ